MKEQPPAGKFDRVLLGFEAARLTPGLACALGMWARAMDDAIEGHMRQVGIETDPQSPLEAGKKLVVGPGKNIVARAGWLAKEVLEGYLHPEEDRASRRVGLPVVELPVYRDPTALAALEKPIKRADRATFQKAYESATPAQREAERALQRKVFRLTSSARRKALQAALDQVAFEERTGWHV